MSQNANRVISTLVCLVGAVKLALVKFWLSSEGTTSIIVYLSLFLAGLVGKLVVLYAGVMMLITLMPEDELLISLVPDVEKGEVLVDSRGTGSFQRAGGEGVGRIG